MSRVTRGIYLDYASTTPVDPSVLEVMLPYFKDKYGNPSSVHAYGQDALAAIDDAREKVAAFLGCSAREVFFTSSATEANNLAIQGVLKAARDFLDTRHIITTQIEHDSVLEVCRALEKEGVEVTYLPVTKEGLVRLESVRDAIRENTVLISIMYANNEIGAVQPVEEIAKIIQQYKTSKSKIHKFFPIFHTDIVQAANYLSCNVDKLGVDLLTLSGHKIYGPKGVGVLYVRSKTPMASLIHGGGQERGLRAGTENVAAIVGFGEAVAVIPQHKKTQKIISDLRENLIRGILASVSGARLNGSGKNRLPNNANFCLPGVDAETLVIALDREGIAVSSGSACSSRAIKPSHVLLAIGLSEKDARSSLRITLGRYTQPQEIDAVLRVLPRIAKKIKMLL